MVFQEICDRYEKTYSWHVKSLVMGKKALDVAEVIVQVLQLPMSKEDLLEESQARVKQVFSSDSLLPGVEKLIHHVRKHSIPCAMATSSRAASFEAKTRPHRDFFGLFHHVVLGDDPEVKNGKLNPDIFLTCAKKFSPPASAHQCLVFEDPPNRVEAAMAASIQVVMVPEANLSRDLTSKATILLSSLQDFRPELFRLPPYK